jgi:hypothetical protein
MKAIVSLIFLFASTFVLPAGAADRTSAFQMEVAPGLELAGQVEILSDADGSWKGLAEKLERTDDGFAGTLTKPGGGQIKFEAKYKKAGQKWDCAVKWEGDSETPSAFIIVSYNVPIDQAKDCELRSGKGVVSFTKMIDQIPALTNFENASEFTMGPILNSTMQFAMGNPSSVQAILLRDEVRVRIIMTRPKDALPASGSVQWTVEKQ